jgi:transposase-like protein
LAWQAGTSTYIKHSLENSKISHSNKRNSQDPRKLIVTEVLLPTLRCRVAYQLDVHSSQKKEWHTTASVRAGASAGAGGGTIKYLRSQGQELGKAIIGIDAAGTKVKKPEQQDMS